MPTQAPPQPQAQHTPETWEHLGASLAHTVIMGARPWACVAAEVIAGWAAHHEWGHLPALPWAACALTLATTGLAAWSWLVSRLPSVGRWHTAVTAAAAGGWLTVATITGPFTQVTGGALAIGGPLLALSWMLRNAARRHHQAAGSAAPQGKDRLKAWFAESADEAGMKGAELHGVRVEPGRATARAELPPGKTAQDLVSVVPRIESAAGMPPGTITAVADPDRADYARVTVSDPRVLSQVQPWPGPSRPGQSIAEPLCPGIYQDSQPVAYVIVGQSIFMMGAAGSGKSMGGGWNLLGEAMTRPDACIVGADMSKGDQTFGPLLPGIHRFERAKDGTRSLIRDVYSVIKPRTDYLADRGLQKWEPGCGLSYLIFWTEESGRIVEALGSKDEDTFIRIALEIRSAGGLLVCSVQRNTFDQMPTIIRAQMASMCFGLQDSNDCRFGLSEAQQSAGVNPAEWGIRTPGKAVLDAAGVPQDRITMPLRTWSWGQGEEASARMHAHATAYPAAARPVDAITAQICGSTRPAAAGTAVMERPSVTLTTVRADVEEDQDQDHDDIPDDDPVADVLGTVDDPSPDITAAAAAGLAAAAAADLDNPIDASPDDEPFDFIPGEKMAPAVARAALAALLDGWRESGMETFQPGDLKAWNAKTGLGRGWLQKVLKEMLDAGELTQPNGERNGYGFPESESDGEN